MRANRGAVLTGLSALWASFALAAETPPAFQWAVQGGGSEIEVGCGIAADPQGNVFVTGFFSGTLAVSSTTLPSSGFEDSFVAKYDVAGRLLWARKAGGAGYDEGRGVAADGEGNAYVAGLFQGAATFGSVVLNSAGQSDIFLAKYDAAGNLIWARRAGGADFDEAYGVAVDASGNAYLTGYFNGQATFGGVALASVSGSNNVFVAKCDRAGNFVWARAAGGDSDDQGNAIAVDSNINIYVTGAFAGSCAFAGTALSAGGTNGNDDVFLAKYDGAGTFLWARQAGGTGEDAGNAVATDSTGHAVVAGRITGTTSFGTTNVVATGADFFLAKYDPAGGAVWVRKGGGNNSIYGDGAQGVKFDSSGNIYAAGYFSRTANFSGTNVATSGLDDVWVAKYDTAGNLLWVRKAGGGDLDVAYALDLDAADNLCLTGFFVGTAAFGATNLTATSSGPDRDLFVAKLSASTPPRLSIRSSPVGLMLSWPAPAWDFVLESTPGFPAPVWSPVVTPPTIVGSARVVNYPPSEPRALFRLRRP